MTTSELSFIEAFLLVAGAALAFILTRRISREAARKVALMAGVAFWLILFGMLPFFVFAILVNRAAGSSPPDGWETFVLNLIPFALLAAPLAGFVQALVSTRGAR